MGKLTAETCEEMARELDRRQARMLSSGVASEIPQVVEATEANALALRIAAATLRWYERTETGGDDHAERQAMIAACKEATSE